MRSLKPSRVFTLIEPGPVVLVTTRDGPNNNIMTISWTMVLEGQGQGLMESIEIHAKHPGPQSPGDPLITR